MSHACKRTGSPASTCKEITIWLLNVDLAAVVDGHLQPEPVVAVGHLQPERVPVYQRINEVRGPTSRAYLDLNHKQPRPPLSKHSVRLAVQLKSP